MGGIDSTVSGENAQEAAAAPSSGIIPISLRLVPDSVGLQPGTVAMCGEGGWGSSGTGCLLAAPCLNGINIWTAAQSNVTKMEVPQLKLPPIRKITGELISFRSWQVLAGAIVDCTTLPSADSKDPGSCLLMALWSDVSSNIVVASVQLEAGPTPLPRFGTRAIVRYSLPLPTQPQKAPQFTDGSALAPRKMRLVALSIEPKSKRLAAMTNNNDLFIWELLPKPWHVGVWSMSVPVDTFNPSGVCLASSRVYLVGRNATAPLLLSGNLFY